MTDNDNKAVDLDYFKKGNHKVIKKRSDSYNEYFRLYRRDRLKNDPNYKILSILRTRLTAALKGKTKSQRTTELLGCSVEDFKTHIESKFSDGMSWDNHSIDGWHIDHIKPCASFDLSSPAQQKECFNYKNLQPLWAKDNLIKNNKF